MAEPIVSHIRNPYLTFPGGVHHFHRRLDPGLPKCDSRPLVSAEPAHHDRVSLHPEVVNLIFRLGGSPVVDRFATVHNMHLPQFMALVPEPQALTIGALSQDWQGRSMYMFPPFLLLNKVIQKLRTTQMGEVILIAPWWPSQLWFPHLLRLSVDHLLRFFLSVLQRPFVTTGLYLKRQVIPSARMEALTQHYQAAGFSREVSKFATAPTCRRPSTNRMYDDRWLRFTTCATGRGFDQTIKGNRSCLASVLSRTGRVAKV